MQYRWIENIDEFRGISKEWDDALAVSGIDNTFLSSDFIIIWWIHFGDNRKLRIFVTFNDGKITGGIPLYLDRGPGAYRFFNILSYVGMGLANYTEPLYADARIGVFRALKSALDGRKGWDALYLPEVRSCSALISEYKHPAQDKRSACFAFQDHMNMSIDISSGRESYMKAVGNRRLREDLRSRRRRAAAECGDLLLKKITGQAEIGRAFDMYAEFSLEAFDRRNRRSNFADERQRSFFRELLVALERKDRIDSYALTAGDAVLAVIFGYRSGKNFNWALTAFNYNYSHLRPGCLLTEELVNEMERRGQSVCNCYGYGSFYKNQWCNSLTPLHRFVMIRKSLKGMIYKTIFNAENSMRSNKTAVSLVRRLKGC
jgi:CelD/BcsL family acetyltransferase involved in cellulose biosynthesis